MNLKKITILLMFNISFILNAQHQISGIVKDTKGNPLIGVTVFSKGLNFGTITNIDGKFSIQAKTNEIISFSYIGYIPTDITIKNAEILIVEMQEDVKVLDEVVVIGYGEQHRKDITGAVGGVKMDDLNKAPVASFDKALAGRIAGVHVSSNDAQPGTEANIVIRGGNSLTQSNSPLYVVDGFPIEDYSSAAISPEDIASMSVLKDASATAIYGSRGANGVIIIETNQGKMGDPKVSYNGYAGFQVVSNTIDLLDSRGFVEYQIERDPGMVTSYLTTPGRTIDDYNNIQSVDWQDLLFRKAFVQSHSVSITGGTNKTRYAVSGSVFEQDGVIKNSGYNRYQGRVSLNQNISDKLRFSINTSFTNDKNYGAITSEQASGTRAYSSYLMYRVWGYRPVHGDPNADLLNGLFDSDEDDETTQILNPIISTENEIRQQTKNQMMSNAYLHYEIVKDLTLRVRGGINRSLTKNESFNNSKTLRGFPFSTNLKGVNGAFKEFEINDWVNENTLTYRKTLNNQDKFDMLIGMTMQGRTRTVYGYESTNIPIEELGLSALQLGVPTSVNSELSQNKLMSFLGRINYNLKSRYLFTASLRTDGSSKFNLKNRWGYFPSGAFAWQMDKEKFMKSVNVVSDSKLRISYGLTGNNRIGDFSQYTSLNLSDYYSFNNQTPGYAVLVENLGNDHLKWETTTQFDLGYDLALFKGRVEFTFDYYNKITSDLLLYSNLPLSSGVNNVYKNIGKMQNNGVEFTLNTTNIKTKNFSYQSEINISFNRNKVLELADNQDNILSSVSWTGDFNNSFLYVAKIGGPAAAFYGVVWDGVYQYEDFNELPNGSYSLKNNITSNGADRTVIQPGDIKYVDQNGDGIVNDKDMVVIGSALPIHTGGFNNNFRYKNFGLNAFFQWSYGNDIFNANRIIFEGNFTNRVNLNQYATYADRWTPEKPSNTYFRAGGQGPTGIYSSRTIEDGSFIRLKTLQFSYSLPKSLLRKLMINEIELYVAGQDLFTWTNYSGLDPEVSVRHSTLTPGFDYSSYGRNRTITFGVKANL